MDSERRVIAFGSFEVALDTGELRRQGMRVRLQEKPFEVLVVLLENPGEAVSREDLRQRLWSDEAYGDFDHNLNNAVNRLRAALGDVAANPRFVETLPRHGYRFIAPVRPSTSGAAVTAENPSRARGWRTGGIAALVVLAVGLATLPLKPWQTAGGDSAPATAAIQRIDPSAEEIYLKARFLWNKKTPETIYRSRDYFLAAIEQDPDYALAYTGLADAYNFLGGLGLLDREEAYRQAVAAAEEALRLQPSLGEAYASLGEARFRIGPDDSEVEPLYRRALELNPRYAIAHYWYGMYLATQGRLAESLGELEQAHRLAPLGLRIQVDLGTIRHLAGDRVEGRRLVDEVLKLDPRSRKAYFALAFMEEDEGRLDLAVDAYRRCVELSPEPADHLPELLAAEALHAPGPTLVAQARDIALRSLLCHRPEATDGDHEVAAS